MKSLRNIFFILSLLVFMSCDDAKEYPWNDAWNEPEPDIEVPEQPQDTIPSVEPSDPYLPVEYEGKARLVWIDAAANFNDYANNKEKIVTDIKKIKETGFTGVIVDVRPTNSGVLFTSSIEDPLTRVDAWVNGYRWLQRTETFDYLHAFIDAGRKEGLEVYASINTMVGGCNCPYGLGTDGLLYADPSKKSWATVINTKEGLMSCLDIDNLSSARLKELGLGESRGTGARFLNPANDEVVEYLTDLLAELAAYEGLTGIILDRCRYDDFSLQSDFSEISREKFEDYIGKEVANWPSDVFSPGQSTLPGSLKDIQKKWLEFRAKVIHDFVEKASDKVHEVNPDIRFGAYVGAWYSSYYESGVNWASPKYETSKYYSKWASDDYDKYGFADHCDIMIIGAYASTSSIYGSTEWTMQGFCQRAETLFAGDVPYVGGPDIGNSTGFANGNQGHLMPSIVDACINSCTGGMFFFDLCHIKMYDYWDDIKTAFDQYIDTL